MENKKKRKPENAECNLDRPSPKDTTPAPFFSGPGLQQALHSRYIQVLLVLTAAGIFLRFYNLTFNSIWLDEAATYTFANNSLFEIWNITVNGTDFNPPLFSWITTSCFFSVTRNLF